MVSRPRYIKCAFCGQSAKELNRNRKQYCSANCRAMASRERNKKPPMLIALEVSEGNRTCLHCGQRFYAKTARGIYCSIKCRVAAHRNERQTNC